MTFKNFSQDYSKLLPKANFPSHLFLCIVPQTYPELQSEYSFYNCSQDLLFIFHNADNLELIVLVML